MTGPTPYILKPLAITQDKRLSFAEQDYLCVLWQLSRDRACTASNRWLADYFQVERARVSEIINSLKRKKIISVDIKRDGKRFVERTIKVIDKGVKESFTGCKGFGGYPVKDSTDIYNKEENKREKSTVCFEDFWKTFRELSPSPVGSKKEAKSQWDRNIKTTSPDVIIEGLRRYAAQHRKLLEAGRFAPQWKHACRWLKFDLWDVPELPSEPGTPSPPVDPENTPGARRIREEARKRYLGVKAC